MFRLERIDQNKSVMGQPKAKINKALWKFQNVRRAKTYMQFEGDNCTKLEGPSRNLEKIDYCHLKLMEERGIEQEE